MRETAFIILTIGNNSTNNMKQIILLAALAMATMASCSSNSSSKPTADPTPAESLLVRMDTLRKHGYMYGHQDDPFYGITWEWEHGDRSDTKELVGDYPAVMGFELGGIEMEDKANLDSVPFDWMREEIIKHHQRGGIVTISWHPRNPLNGKTAWIGEDTIAYNKLVAEGVDPATLVNPKQTVHEMLEGGSIHDKALTWIGHVSDFIGSLKTPEGEVVPVIFRPWHENTGNWFWWGETNCSAEDYKTLWNMTQDYMNEQLPGQLVWSYSPSPRSMEHFLERWPGDDRVQLLGVDAYQWGTEEEFKAGLQFGLQFMNEYVKEHPMLIAVTECGRVNSDIPDWWTRVFDPIARQYPICYCLPWRNAAKEHFGASKDASTAEDFKLFYAQPHTLFLNDIK